jgi:ABC-type bacteriocin/lantibiotic exporter with double-glycine peptidase domain
MAGCSGPPVTSIEKRRQPGAVGVPIVMQARRSGCGLAALATMLSVLGKPITLADIGSGVAVPERGLSMLDLQRL